MTGTSWPGRWLSLTSGTSCSTSFHVAEPRPWRTTCLTPEVRLAWQAEPDYNPGLDLVLVDESDRIQAFAVSYLHGDTGEIGTVGVIPGLKGRGLSMVMVAAALDRLVSAGATSVTMSTASTNTPMLATARRAGFAEVRRTTWWHRPSTD